MINTELVLTLVFVWHLLKIKNFVLRPLDVIFFRLIQVDISAHVLKILGQFLPDVKKTMITSCHGGAANRLKASKLMKVESYQHCVAHALHSLLTVDDMDTIEELVTLIQR